MPKEYMTNKEVYDLYKELELNSVSFKQVPENSYTAIHYLFGAYDIMYAKWYVHTQFCAYDELYICKSGHEIAAVQPELIDNPGKKQIYEIYESVKNKYENKPYNSVYKTITKSIDEKASAFEKHISNDSKNFLPEEMSTEQRVRTILQLKHTFKDVLLQFYIK